MQIIRAAFLAILALVLVTMALANRGMVTLRAMPDALADLLNLSPVVEMPLFVAIFIGIALGLLIGFVWEWLREHKHRAEARRKAREVNALEAEVDRLRAEKHEGKDEVLALLETSDPAR